MLPKILTIIVFFLNLWQERNTVQAEKKKEIAQEIIHAIAETNPETQASLFNTAIGRINRLRSK